MPKRKSISTIRWLLRPLLVQRRQYWRAVLICFLSAFTFWVLNALNEPQTMLVTQPVQFSYNKSTYEALQPLPATLQVKVSAKGWLLLRRALGLKHRHMAVIPLQGLPNKKSLQTNDLLPYLQQAQPNALVKAVYPATVPLHFKAKPATVTAQ